MKKFLLCAFMLSLTLVNGHFFQRNDWNNLKSQLEKPSPHQITVFVLLVNTAAAKQHINYVHHAIYNFEQSGSVFSYINGKRVSNDQYYFMGFDHSKSFVNYVQKKLSAKDSSAMQEWLRDKPVLVLKLTNRGQAVLMHNADSLHQYLLLNWIEKQTKLPLVKHARQMSNLPDLTVSVLNMLTLLISMGFFIHGTRTDNFLLRQFSMLPVIFFISGHVFNQIQGNANGDLTFLGIWFSRRHNGQCFGESLFLFVLYSAFAFSTFKFMEELKQSDKPLVQKTAGGGAAWRRRGNFRAKSGAAAAGKASSGKAGEREWAYLSLSMLALWLIHHSYVIKL